MPSYQMLKRMALVRAFAPLLLLGMLYAASTSAASQATWHWYRGNTHTHTHFKPDTDANETADNVVEWYKGHGYQFVVITDHENLTDVGPLNAAHGEPGKFLVIQGQEITQMIRAPDAPFGRRHAHVNGIGTQRLILPIEPNPANVPMADAYVRNIAEVAKAGGLAQVNHPNLTWSVKAQDLAKLNRPFLIEVWNAFSTSNNLGGVDEQGHSAPSTEALWDQLLSAGQVVWGTASDDSHTYHQFDDPSAPNPGRGWVVVRASELSSTSVTEALRHGDFYASTGIHIVDYEASVRRITIRIERLPEWSPSLPPSTRYETRFIGKGGRVLATVPGLEPAYQIKGNEGYVRASIIDSDGRRAWTQPIFLDHRLEKTERE
jgi:hypothetical protein